MNALTREWVEKAEADCATAHREVRVSDTPNYDGVCFHAQQCVEKYLKAVLQESGLHVPRTHDLVALLALTHSVAPSLQRHQADLAYLTSFAVEFRYPGYNAANADALRAVAIASAVRTDARAHFGLL